MSGAPIIAVEPASTRERQLLAAVQRRRLSAIPSGAAGAVHVYGPGVDVNAAALR